MDPGKFVFVNIHIYPNFGKILLHDKLRSFVHKPNLIDKNQSIKKCLEVPSKLRDKPKSHVFPILAKRDEYVDYSRAREYWRGYETKVFDTGHYTIALKVKEIRELIKEKVLHKS